jgi:hypothetical protein
MRKYILFVLFIIFNYACKNSDNKKEEGSPYIAATAPIKDQEFSIDALALTKDFRAWNTYNYYNIKLSQDFVALNTDGLL